MNQFAMCLGYFVMVSAGVLAASALALFAFERAFVALNRRKTWSIVNGAVREWTRNHPEEAAKARERER
ncbi:hypothetical protein [Burkholderia gladioli]|uniref:hypothetical protein n=1 Tax=Burkholderia gladioli TaxID=28095 RepID=UPI00163E6214|nr:hypothetical protein [Burkholderia gladioli]